MGDETQTEVKSESPDEKPQELNKEETAPETTESKNLVDRSFEAVEAMKAENDRRERLIEREEALYAKQLLGGKADAGNVPKTKEQEAQEEAEKILSRYK